MSATKRKSSDTQRNRGGRPRIGAEPLTVADRSRRYRAKRRAQVQVETPEDAGVRRAEEALKSLCASRDIREGTSEHLIASRWINAMAEKAYNDAVKLMDMLPPRITADTSSPVVAASDVKEKLLAAVMANVEADEYEEQREVDRLRLENADLRRRLGEPEGLLEANKPKPEPKVLTPSTGDIVPPREQSDNPANMRPPRYDEPRKPVTIDHEPVKAAAPTSAPSGAWTGPQDGPPPWLQTPAQNAARAAVKASPPPAAASAAPPAAPAAPTPSSQQQRTQSWDSTPGGQAWHAFCDAGGYGGGFEPAQGWIDKLNGRG